MASVWYCTREDVTRALDIKETARAFAQVDRLIESCSRGIEGRLHRKFYPELATRSFDWPTRQNGTSWRLWLEGNDLISVSSLTSGGVVAAPADVLLEPQAYGPPYDRIEMSLSGSASFGFGDTYQRNISITGLFGFTDDQAVAGTIAEALDASETLVDIANSALVGVGDVIKVESERMLVTNKHMLTTGQTTTVSLTTSNAEVLVGVGDGSAIFVGEVVLVDAERMLVVDIAGNNLVVKRAWDGSTLAAHNSAATVYAGRTLAVTRGALGTVGAAHSDGTAMSRWLVPSPVNQLCIGEVLSALQNEGSAYARVVGTGESTRVIGVGQALMDLRDTAMRSCGRAIRIGVV